MMPGVTFEEIRNQIVDAYTYSELDTVLRERMNLGSEVVLVGQFDHFELWPEAAWNASNDAGQAGYADAYAALNL